MTLSKREQAAQIMEHVCKHDAHGYSQPNRAGDGTIETVTLSDGTPVYIHGGDYDCSELVRMCYRAADVLPYGSYMWTGNEDTLLRANGFERVPVVDAARGDVLLRDGHTALYLGDGKIGEAYYGDKGLTGVKGDQDGTEVRIANFYPSRWERCYRYTKDLKEHETRPLLNVDGYWGPATTRELQRIFNTTIDGVVSHQVQDGCKAACTVGWQYDKTYIGSELICAMQHWLGVNVDGLLGPISIKALQKKMWTTVDGKLDAPSACVKQMQRFINAGNLLKR